MFYDFYDNSTIPKKIKPFFIISGNLQFLNQNWKVTHSIKKWTNRSCVKNCAIVGFSSILCSLLINVVHLARGVMSINSPNNKHISWRFFCFSSSLFLPKEKILFNCLALHWNWFGWQVMMSITRLRCYFSLDNCRLFHLCLPISLLFKYLHSLIIFNLQANHSSV